METKWGNTQMFIRKSTALALTLAMVATMPAYAQQGSGKGSGQGNPGAHFMENWDLDANGTVTVEELQMRRGDVFTTFYSNEDGFIDAAEYVMFDEARAADMENNAGHAGHGQQGDYAAGGMALQANDADADGKVSREEFVQGAVSWAAMLDRDQDGAVTAGDFGK